MKQKGTIKWFNNAKGYGFIVPQEGEGDIFAHYSAINMEGYKTLRAGQAVTFELQQGDKGMHAVDISPDELDPSSAVQHPQDAADSA